MKRIFFVGLTLCFIILATAPSNPNNNRILVQTKDTNIPDWRWTSGEVEMEKTAAKQCFIISFDPKIYHSRDSIIITFSSIKVAINNPAKGKNFGQWKGKISLVYFINNNWIPLVEDTDDILNQSFSGKNGIEVDSLKNYSLRLTVPLSKTLTLTTSAVSYEMDNDNSLPRSGAGIPTLTAFIRGVEIRKLNER